MPFPVATRRQIENRLKEEGRYAKYRSYRTFLYQRGVEFKDAWRVAALLFPPQKDAPPELLKDKRYAEIIARVEKGEFPPPPELATFPNGLINYAAPVEATPEQEKFVEEIKKAPQKFKDKYEQLAAKLDITMTVPVLDAISWAVNRESIPIEMIKVETIPSPFALTLLRLLKTSDSNCVDIVKQYLAKAMPDKKTLEYEARIRDDKGPLGLLDQFDEEFAGGETEMRESA